MPVDTRLETAALDYVEERRSDLIGIARDLIRIPSENAPPDGAEGACQDYCAAFLRKTGFRTDVYLLDDVPGLRQHPLFWTGRDYRRRPNVAGQRSGSGGGCSLILSGHIDTVPRGTLPWTRDPFSGELEGDRLYGRGANDMKAGIATNLFVARAVGDLAIPLRGTLTIESVVDEEFGGVNGTLAGRLRGYTADAAIISEPSFLRVCPAQRGGRTAHITFRTPGGGILAKTAEAGIAPQLAWFLSAIPAFAAERRATAPPHPQYAHLENPAPVSVMRISSGPWSTHEPMATADTCRVELFWQTMPGEQPADVDAQFHRWLEGTVTQRPDLFASPPEVEFPYRWLPGSAIDRDHALVRELSSAAEAVLGAAPPVAGIEGPCDMFVFQQVFGIPTVLWGVRGGNTHAADEYVEVDSLVNAAKALLLFVLRWCR